MIRRSLSCMLAGLLIAGPITYAAFSGQMGWHPHGWLIMTILAVPIFGVMILYDEIKGY